MHSRVGRQDADGECTFLEGLPRGLAMHISPYPRGHSVAILTKQSHASMVKITPKRSVVTSEAP